MHYFSVLLFLDCVFKLSSPNSAVYMKGSMSIEQNPGWLLYIGIYSTQFYGDNFTNNYSKFLLTNQYSGMSHGFKQCGSNMYKRT